MMQENDIQMTFRSSADPDPHLPLSVRSTGLYDLSDSWSEVPRQKGFLQIFLIIEGTLSFRSGKKWNTAESAELFQYYPGDIHQVRVASRRSRFFWTTYDHPKAVQWVRDMGFRDRLLKVMPYREGLYESIASALKNCTPAGDRLASNAAFSMLLSLREQDTAQKPDSLAGRARKLMNTRFADSRFSITVLANELEVHRTTLMRAFKQEFEISPSRYLQNLRVQHALTLLKKSVNPVQEVAAATGFVDPNYFARIIRQKTGLSPLEFRSS